MKTNVSVVINTLNEEINIERAISSVKWADEIIVCDMCSDDKTVEIAKKHKVKVMFHKRVGYVEPARNFAISKASRSWILILDADEEIPNTLAKRLQSIVKKSQQVDYVEIPRKNIIFGKWIQNSFWWPDYNVRFFKKGKIVWSDKIHSKPKTSGLGIKLPDEEEYAIIHYNYFSLDQYLERANRYSKQQAKELIEERYKFHWSDLVSKPLGEFLSRYFANSGYKDGIHGLSLSLLQAFSHLLVYLRIWEKQHFSQQEIDLEEFRSESNRWKFEINYWMKQTLTNGKLFKIFQKVKSKFI